jgi:hypothetical protein
MARLSRDTSAVVTASTIVPIDSTTSVVGTSWKSMSRPAANKAPMVLGGLINEYERAA